MNNSELHNPALHAASVLANEAVSALVKSGMSVADATAKVESNFEQFNASGQIITIDLLTK